MRSKQSFLFILIGLGCATLAVIVLRKYMSGSGGPTPPPPGINMLVATRDIAYGDELQLPAKGKDGNVIFVSTWPAKLKLKGGLTDPEAFKKRRLRAVADLVEHQPILESLVADDEVFIPPDLTVQTLPTNSKDIRITGVRPGMLVDIYEIDKGVPRLFMQNVRVYAMGALDAHMKPVQKKDAPPNVHILIKKEDTVAFITAIAGNKFKVIEASDPSAGGPVLIATGVNDRVRREKAQAMLETAQGQMREGNFEEALEQLRQIVADYADLKEVSVQAGKAAGECVNRIAERLYGKAERAFKVDGNYQLALELIDEIERSCQEAEGVIARARQLQVSVQEALAANRALVRYQGVLADTEKALATGDLPAAEQLLPEIEAFEQQKLPAEAAVKQPAEAFAEYKEKLETETSKFKIDRQVLEAHVKQRNVEQAKQKLAEMKEEFPAHPEMRDLEALVGGIGA